MTIHRSTLLACLLTLLTACDGGGISINNGPDNDASIQTDSGAPSPDFGNWTPPPNSCSGCEAEKVGINGTPYTPGSSDSEGVSADKDGALVIDKTSSKLNRYLWVADTNLPGVAKIDLETMTIVARYITGGSSTSRTTVNALGEAFIGSRADGNGKAGVTKVSPLGSKCPDTNGDGVITTSTGPDNVLPYGQDDCVLWHTETQGDIRGLAAQDIAGTQHDDICKSFDPSKEFDPNKFIEKDEHYIWVGGLHGMVYKIDSETGKILIATTSPMGVYGAALAGDGKLWVGSGGGLAFGFIDTTKCVDQASCDAAQVCTVACTETACPATCDGAAKASITGQLKGYGITVDHKQRVWRSGYPTAGVMRYDSLAPANQRLAHSTAPAYGGGIAADAQGWVWAANLNGGVVRVNADTMAHTSIPVASKGIAVDAAGRVFAVEYNGAVHLIEPGATLDAYTLTANAIPLKGIAYAYSDMTGIQTRLAANDPGWYRSTFAPCPTVKVTDWQFLTYDVEVPAKTWVMFNVRTADTAEDLKKAAWATVACIGPPGGPGQVSIKALKGRMVEAEVRFVANGDLNNPTSIQSARIKSFGTLYRCMGVN